ncbi:MAG: pyridoxamine 5'-phosphate oxidase family protein [Salinivirgaceae bacterium]|jgi:nitroimidazol reductase NimA-like FMN-containing flavoprotein (pyridoxamine 5'-phosphate oxidase superfamily)|nr:pyridoxamine 5'-phosphate oxidase family protein [Salinivirgaceae bacterium]
MNRRKTTFLKKLKDIEPIIKKCDVCHVAMIDVNNKPYVLPFNFGYHEGYIYLHSDPIGKKMDALKKNPNVCINFTTDHELFHITEHVACSYGMRYKSIVVNGVIEFITDREDKVEAMNIFMDQYVKNKEFCYSDPAIENVCVYKVKVEDFSGKVYGYDDI